MKRIKTKIHNALQLAKSYSGIIRFALYLVIGAILVFGIISAIVPLLLIFIAIELLVYARWFKSGREKRQERRREKVIYGSRIS